MNSRLYTLFILFDAYIIVDQYWDSDGADRWSGEVRGIWGFMGGPSRCKLCECAGICMRQIPCKIIFRRIVHIRHNHNLLRLKKYIWAIVSRWGYFWSRDGWASWQCPWWIIFWTRRGRFAAPSATCFPLFIKFGKRKVIINIKIHNNWNENGSERFIKKV